MSVSVGQVEQSIEKIAPRSWAEEWDNPGLLVGSSSQQVHRILLSLDTTMEVIDEAVREKAGLIVSHHPLMFKPLKNLRIDNPTALLPLTLFRSGISLYAAHTNLDQSILSSSLTLAKLLGLQKTEFLQVTSSEKLVKIVTFVPEENAEEVRKELAAEGVGSGITDGEHSDNYAECFYQSRGEGLFRPLAGSEPAIGKIGELTRVAEIRLESIVEERFLSRAVKALHRAHPYEEPAYDLIPLMNTGKKRGYGMIGSLPEPMALGDLPAKIFPGEFDRSSVRLAGNLQRKIRKIAVLNGSGSSFIPKALSKGADLYITGDIDYHGVLDALQGGMAVIELGHFLSEIPMIQSLYAYLRGDKTFKDIELIISSANKIPWVSRG
ncbi:MAG: GTP cyclohydrolase 1 type 2 [Candidatus Dichloromethanomonas elyunquensis]|nr:MAG: GTP cyclohydrolase 1 type 2 [Candidatus Dichloromethanomonas elyunquensis]